MSPSIDMHYNLKLNLAYDGSCYYGWQNTKTGPSIEGALQEVLFTILQHPIELQAASRTDAGVHAEDQVVNFLTHHASLDLEKILISINQLLPEDIRVYSIEYTSLSFHPTLDSVAKEYHYYVSTQKWLSPFRRAFVWHIPKMLDLTLMQQAAQILVGKHDFQGLTNTRKPPHQDTIREIFSLDIIQEGEEFCFQIKGDHFLYKMVRNIVGTLCYIGSHKLSEQDLKQALEEKTRSLAGMTAPASGLFLKKIYYNNIKIPHHDPQEALSL